MANVLYFCEMELWSMENFMSTELSWLGRRHFEWLRMRRCNFLRLRNYLSYRSFNALDLFVITKTDWIRSNRSYVIVSCDINVTRLFIWSYFITSNENYFYMYSYTPKHQQTASQPWWTSRGDRWSIGNKHWCFFSLCCPIHPNDNTKLGRN